MKNTFWDKFRKTPIYPFIGGNFTLFVICTVIYSTIIYKGDWGIIGALFSNTFFKIYLTYSTFFIMLVSINILYSVSKYYEPSKKEPMLIFDIGAILALILFLQTLLSIVTVFLTW